MKKKIECYKGYKVAFSKLAPSNEMMLRVPAEILQLLHNKKSADGQQALIGMEYAIHGADKGYSLEASPNWDGLVLKRTNSEMLDLLSLDVWMIVEIEDSPELVEFLSTKKALNSLADI
jgi:hypothetical protein